MSFLLPLFAASLISCGSGAKSIEKQEKKMSNMELNKIDLGENPADGMDSIVLGAGCFWCVEAVFQRLEGVDTVISGFAGGHVKNPAYKEVVTGRTGHAEVAKVTYDPKVISLAQILEVFWMSHDPTQLNKQGNDVGTQYRSAIFYRNNYQKQVAEKSLKTADESGLWKKEIVTEVSELDAFYAAEDYHQNYYNNNSSQPYCSYVISPKVEKVEKLFKDKMKEAYLNKE